jgi:hypothetical protein
VEEEQEQEQEQEKAAAVGHGTRTGQEVPRAEVRIHMAILRKLTFSL